MCIRDSHSGNTAPDGQGLGTSTAKVRAERVSKGNGRVYYISFTADDIYGGSCSGMVTCLLYTSLPICISDSGML